MPKNYLESMCGLRQQMPVVFFAAFKMRSHAYLKLRFLWLHLNSDSEYRRWVFVTHLLEGKDSFLKDDSLWVQTWVWVLINLFTLGILASLSGWALPPHSEKPTYRWKGKGFKKGDISDYTGKNMLIVYQHLSDSSPADNTEIFFNIIGEIHWS